MSHQLEYYLLLIRRIFFESQDLQDWVFSKIWALLCDAGYVAWYAQIGAVSEFSFTWSVFDILRKTGRVGWSERTASKHVYYQVWNRSPAQVGCMRQVLGAGALGWPRGMGWGGRWEGGSGWGTPVNPWLIHVNVWQKPLQYCKVISL